MKLFIEAFETRIQGVHIRFERKEKNKSKNDELLKPFEINFHHMVVTRAHNDIVSSA